MCETGIVWDVTGADWEVLLVGCLGWSERGPKGNRRSHQIEPKGPVFVWVRDAADMGKEITFAQLRKMHVHPFFVQGVPHALVDVEILAVEKKFLDQFILRAGNNLAGFEAVTLEVISIPVPVAFKSSTTRRKRSRRLLELEERQLQADVAREREQTIVKAKEKKAEGQRAQETSCSRSVGSRG